MFHDCSSYMVQTDGERTFLMAMMDSMKPVNYTALKKHKNEQEHRSYCYYLASSDDWGR